MMTSSPLPHLVATEGEQCSLLVTFPAIPPAEGASRSNTCLEQSQIPTTPLSDHVARCQMTLLYWSHLHQMVTLYSYIDTRHISTASWKWNIYYPVLLLALLGCPLKRKYSDIEEQWHRRRVLLSPEHNITRWMPCRLLIQHDHPHYLTRDNVLGDWITCAILQRRTSEVVIIAPLNLDFWWGKVEISLESPSR